MRLPSGSKDAGNDADGGSGADVQPKITFFGCRVVSGCGEGVNICPRADRRGVKVVIAPFGPID